jgi:hypothetical protein
VGRISKELAEFYDGHRIGGEAWIPAANHLTMIAGAALARSNKNGAVRIEDVIFERPMLATEGTYVHCELVRNGAEVYHGSEEVCVRANRSLALDKMPHIELKLENVLSRCTNSIQVEVMYKDLAEMGAEFVGSFRSILEAWEGEDEAVAKITDNGVMGTIPLSRAPRDLGRSTPAHWHLCHEDIRSLRTIPHSKSDFVKGLCSRRSLGSRELDFQVCRKSYRQCDAGKCIRRCGSNS